jgi:hypothetical protein
MHIVDRICWPQAQARQEFGGTSLSGATVRVVLVSQLVVLPLEMKDFSVL